MEQIIFNNIRVQLLSNDIVRVEVAKKGAFCDDNTFFIPDRTQYAQNTVAYSFNEGVLCFGDYELYLPEGGKSLFGLRLDKNGKKVYSYKRLANTGELPALGKTPEVFAIADTPRIIIPEGGYSKNRNGQYKVTENVQDVYLLLCQKDAKKLRRLYVELTGRPELVRLSTLGSWNSKYYAYTEQTAKQLILDFEAHNVPLDNMVIDTDWRSCENGWGYDINKQLFPNMKRFLDFAHAHGVDVMFNDHPEPVDGVHVFRAKEIAYRERNLQSLMSKGLDTWWYDRNWGTRLVSPSKNLQRETLGLYLYHDITKHFYQKQANDSQIYRRADIMGNAVNIINGFYQTITDSASHRYSIQWTGDIDSTPSDLCQEVSTLVKVGANCIPYINADCGGHVGNPGKEGFIRWMQFGTLSPVFRPHCTNYATPTREPWQYDQETLDIVREYNNLRYRLLPVIYKNAYSSYQTGEPICKPLGWEYLDDKNALKCFDEYMLGNDILVRPVASSMCKTIERNHYVTDVTATYYNGTELQGEPIATTQYDVLDMVLNNVSPLNGVPVYNYSARFSTNVRFTDDVTLYIVCDDGATVWIDGEKVFEDKTLHSARVFPLKKISKGIIHSVEIEYFQAGGEAAIQLMYVEQKHNDDKMDIYLPQGKWVDVFDGKIYDGNKTIRKSYGLREMPLFVRMGALIPLAYQAQNTKEQTWDDIVLDYYPDQTATDNGFIYEDDTETTAYKLGQFAKTPYDARFDAQQNAYIVTLHETNGRFDGAKYFDKRNVTVKFHLINGVQNVNAVTINGAQIDFETNGKNVSTFPLNTAKSSPDGKVVTVTFTAETNKSHEIKFYL